MKYLILLLLSFSVNATTLCGNYDTINSSYRTFQNNVWNDVSGSQCIDVINNSMTVTKSIHNKPTNGAPASYPSVFVGCHWNVCSNNSILPKQINTLQAVAPYFSMTPVSGVYNTSFDLWFKTTSGPGVPDAGELMIWINKVGNIQPIGSVVRSNVSICGQAYDVWYGGNNVISYVARRHSNAMYNCNVLSFVNDAIYRGYLHNQLYLQSIEAGFEIWQGGQGLRINNFSALIR